MGKFTAYKDNYWACDFETTSKEFYDENGYVRVWLAHAQKFDPNIVDGKCLDKIYEVTIEDFFEQFWKRKESATLFFHNLAFDGEFIKWYLVENGYQYFYEAPKRKVSKGFLIFEDEKNIYHIQVWKRVRVGNNNKTIQLYIRCSLNLLRLSIADLGEVYKIGTKGNIDYNVQPFNKIEDVNQEYLDYITTDVSIMIPALQQYNEIFTIQYGNRTVQGLSKLTISSTALQLFKAFIYEQMDFKNEFFLDYDTVNELTGWYSGGLCTFPQKYQQKLTEDINGHVYDVNSMYPAVMVKNPYPYGEPYYGETPPNKDYKIKMVEVFIKKAQLKDDKFPPLMRPWKSATIQYQKGVRFVTYTENAIARYFEDELISLQRFYDIDYEVTKTIWFKGKHYFKEFITKHYALRKKYKEEGDPREQTVKLLLNSAYGKFGQKPDKTTIVYSLNQLEIGDTIIEGENPLIVETVRNQDSCIGDLNCYICNYERPKERNINVAIAACVTKNARLKLHDAIWENQDTFLYCDTDSIFLKGEAKGIEIDKSVLGAWKCEGTFNSFELGGAKLYQIWLRGAQGEELFKNALAGINKKWANQNLKKGDIIQINKELGLGSKLLKHKVKGGILIEETTYTIKDRNKVA